MKKITTLAGLVFLISFCNLNGQTGNSCSSPLCGANLVPNAGFEDCTTLCQTASQGDDGVIYIDKSPVKEWSGLAKSKKAASSSGCTIYNMSADYYNSTCECPPIGQTTNCGEGKGSAGFLAGAPGPINNQPGDFLEYLQVKLTEKLKKNTEYCVSFKVKINSTISGKSDGVGIWFHNKGQLDINTMNDCKEYIGPGSKINAIPQIANKPGNLIDSICQTINGTFIANGDEEWMVIGNFNKKGDTKFVVGNSIIPWAYLIVDEISVKEICNSTGLMENINGLPFEISSVINKSVAIKLNNQLSQENYLIQVFNSEGEMITNKTISVSDNSKVNLDLSAFSSGLYFISLSKNSTILFTKKIILNEF